MVFLKSKIGPFIKKNQEHKQHTFLIAQLLQEVERVSHVKDTRKKRN